MRSFFVHAIVLLLIAPVAAALAAPSAAEPATTVPTPAPLAAVGGATFLPTPGVNCGITEPLTGRLFPEAMETNDYVSYDEALCGLDRLATALPDRMRVVEVGQSVGWASLMGGHETFDVFIVEVTHFDSAIAWEDKPKIVFQLSIHGNEKGGREGGLRVIEDFVRGDVGLAAERPDLVAMLDLVGLVFVFPNPDGWTHEEADYRHNDACYFSITPNCQAGQPGLETQGFVRTNGHGVDLNREYPTSGWVRERHSPLSEPEVVALVDHLLTYRNVRYASDIHGMLNPADFEPDQCADERDGELHLASGACDPETRGHFVLTMLPAGRQSPSEMAKTTTLAERVKTTLNSNPYYVEWNTLPSFGAWGGTYNEWGTVWDTLGYTDSGFTSDWYAQDIGLNAPGVDFELAYNHVTFDNYYPGVAQRMNAYHVESVRDIVQAFMEQTGEDIAYTVNTNGVRTAYLVNPAVLTNEGALGVTGWAAENPLDDAYDTQHVTFAARPNDYFDDLKPVLRDGEAAGVLDELGPADVANGALAGYDAFVIASQAWATIASDASAVDAISAFVTSGGKLFLSDQALGALEALGLVPEGGVDVYETYAGYTNFITKDDPLVADVRGLARETFEPTPLGFTLQEGGAAPIHFVAAEAFDGDVIGIGGTGQQAIFDPSKVTFGRLALGAGEVVFLGAFLPTPTADHYSPYGADAYATTYTSNQLLRNALGWTESFESTPLTPDNALMPAATGDVSEGAKRIPAPSAVVAVLLAAFVALGVARRR